MKQSHLKEVAARIKAALREFDVVGRFGGEGFVILLENTSHHTAQQVAERMRREGVPCDALYLDIHYMDVYRVFTWDSDRFADLGWRRRGLLPVGCSGRQCHCREREKRRELAAASDHPASHAGSSERSGLRLLSTGTTWSPVNPA